MPIVGGGSIIPGDGGIAPTTDDTRSGGGGGGTSNIPNIPAVVQDVDGGTSSVQFTMTNTGSSPVAVELSFSSLAAGKTLLKAAPGFDAGDELSPTYVIDPTDPAAQTRTITLQRGSLAPTNPAGELEQVTATASTGIVPTTLEFNIIPASTMAGLVRQFSGIPTLEYKFEGNLNNTGSLSGYTATSSASPVETSDLAGLNGRIELTHDINVTGVNKNLFNASKDRTWFIVWGFPLGGYLTWNQYLQVLTNNGSNNGPGYIRTQPFGGGNIADAVWATSSPTQFLSSAGTGFPSGTTPHGLKRGGYDGGVNFLAVSYDHAARVHTQMYRQIRYGNPSGVLDPTLTQGHTFRTKSETGSTSGGNVTMEVFNTIASTNAGAGNPAGRGYYFAIVDNQTTNQNFADILSGMNL